MILDLLNGPIPLQDRHPEEAIRFEKRRASISYGAFTEGSACRLLDQSMKSRFAMR